jgi:SpoIID/LytB domain protein
LNSWPRSCALTLILLAALCPQAGASGQKPVGDERHARYSFYQGNYPEAAQEYYRLWERSGDDPGLARDLAAVLMALRRFSEASRVLQAAGIEGRELAEARLASGDLPGALKALRSELATPGDHTRTRLLLGLAFFYQRDYARSLEQLGLALHADPKQATLRLFRARCFLALAEGAGEEREYFEERAREEYRLAREYDPSLWQVHRDLAHWAVQRGDWPAAWSQWQTVVSMVGTSGEVEDALRLVRGQLPAPTATPTPAAAAVRIPAKPRLEITAALPLAPDPSQPTLTIGLNGQTSRLAFAGLGAWRARDPRGRQIWEGLPRAGYRLERQRGEWVLTTWEGKRLKSFRKALTLETLDPNQILAVFDFYQSTGYFFSVGERKTRYYRGRLKVKTKGQFLQVVNELPLDAYLLSVVPSEMPADWSLEALKAQAVVARTFALGHRRQHGSQGFDFCASAHCAYYSGVAAEHPRSTQAVTETSREVLRQDGHLLPTFFSHSCGGMTQGYREAWWQDPPVYQAPAGVYDGLTLAAEACELPLRPGVLAAWLAGSPPVYCNDPDFSALRNFRWLKVLTAEELSTRLEPAHTVGAIQHLTIQERSPNGYVRKLLVEGSEGRVVLTGDRIRTLFGGLRSNLFDMLPIPAGDDGAEPTAWLIWGGGWGHGVGLCQVGAGRMGRGGVSYRDILRHYFPEAEVELWP